MYNTQKLQFFDNVQMRSFQIDFSSSVYRQNYTAPFSRLHPYIVRGFCFAYIPLKFYSVFQSFLFSRWVRETKYPLRSFSYGM